MPLPESPPRRTSKGTIQRDRILHILDPDGEEGAYPEYDEESERKKRKAGGIVDGAAGRTRGDKARRGRADGGKVSDSDKDRLFKQSFPKSGLDTPTYATTNTTETGSDRPPGSDKGRAVGGKTPNFNPGGHKGKLHRELNIPVGEKIGKSRLAEAAHSSDPEIKRDAIRAQTMGKWKK